MIKYVSERMTSAEGAVLMCWVLDITKAVGFFNISPEEAAVAVARGVNIRSSISIADSPGIYGECTGDNPLCEEY